MWKLTLIFALIIFLLNRRWHLGYVLLLASLVLGLLFGLSLPDILGQVWIAVSDPKGLRLLAAVLLITALGELMRQIKSTQQLVLSLQELFNDPRLVLAIVPAIIGLLPMPGGAMVSAPMIEEIGSRIDLRPERKTFLNYWFRHVWEYVFPMYPALIVLSGLVSIPLSRIVRAQIPLTVGAIAGGALLGLRTIGRAERGQPETGERHRWRSLWMLAVSIWPIVLVIFLSLVVELELALSLLLAILLAAVVHRVSYRTMMGVLRRGISLRMALLVLGIMIFKQMVLASEGAATLATSLVSWGIPTVVSVVAIPAVIGLLTGLTLSMVGIAFPLLLPLITGSDLYLNYVVLAFAAGFAAILLSPVHLCLALTKEYFNAAWPALYRLLLPAAAVLALAAAVAWFII